MQPIISYLSNLNPVLQALLAGIFTWGLTALGSAGVFFNKEINKRLLSGMLGFAAGVMIAASCWSLLDPSIHLAGELGLIPWLPPVIGFLVGGIFLFTIDKVLPHLNPGFDTSETEGIHTSWQRSILLVMAMTIHNIPEGLAVGVAFGAAVAGIKGATLASAIALAIGIGLQNFPEGLAVSAPLRGGGLSRMKSFMYGQASALVEPISAVIGAATVMNMRQMLPYAQSFAAGAMIYVVVEELIPESQRGESTDIATIGAMVGFALMMLLDVALG
jgi:zinc transporter, ZIP family